MYLVKLELKKFIPIFIHNTDITTIASTPCLTAEHVKIMSHMIPSLETVSAE